MSETDIIHTLEEALREGKENGERLISRLRLMIVLLAPVSVLLVLLTHPGLPKGYLVMALIAWTLMLLYAFTVHLVLHRGLYRPGLGYLTLFLDAIGLGLYLMALSFFKPGYIGALYEPLFAVYYIISVSGTIKYDFKYSFFSVGICAGMVFLLTGFDSRFHTLEPSLSLIAEKLLMLVIFTLISIIFHNMFTRIVVAEHQLMSRRYREISTILTIGSDISSRRKLEKTLETIVQETQTLLQADLCYLAWPGETGSREAHVITSGTRSLGAMPLCPGHGLEGRLLATGEPLIAGSPQELASLCGRATAGHLTAEGVHAVLGVPMSIEGEIIGVFVAARRRSQPFSGYDRILLSTLSQQAALTLQNALLFERLHHEHQPFLPAPQGQGPVVFEGMLGASPAMQRLYALIGKASSSDHPVLIRGESGTGKELVARALHARSPRAQGPFITINCAAIPETLLASELFGHERGAFTGAIRRKRGRFELAHTGTLFLDEIGDMGLVLQTKLLRVLQEQVFERLGGETPLRVDVRVISATHQDLKAKIASGTFREDLYYRINTLPIYTPALRERREDIPLLVEHFIAVCGQGNNHELRLSQAAMDYLTGRDWKGNVRELENLIKRMVTMAEHDLLQTADVEDLIGMLEPGPAGGDPATLRDYAWRKAAQGCSLADEAGLFERTLIEAALSRSGGNISEAGRILNLPKSTLFNKIQKHGLSLEDGGTRRHVS